MTSAREQPGGRRNAPLSRRRFVQGLLVGGTIAALDLWQWPALAVQTATRPSLLSGDHFDLAIENTPVNFTGRPRIATATNGLVPGPTLRWREGDTVTIAVTNRLRADTSIHWHGIRTPSEMDGVPGLSFPGIRPNETFVYRFPVRQSGTYWYHSHSHFQEQTGHYGALIIDPAGKDPIQYDRDYVILLSDWTDEDPETVLSNLKMKSDYYNYGQRTAQTFVSDVQDKGLGATVSDRLTWGRMNMSPTDLSDVSGATYTYLINGHPPAANWTALFNPGERVRLRFINGSSMTIFDVRIPGLPMTVVQTDGNDVEPVAVDEFRISVAETYDVIVQPKSADAFTVFAQALDRSGYARATLAPRSGMSAPIPPMDPRPMLTMVDMGMGNESGMAMSREPPASNDRLRVGPQVDSVAESPTERLDEPGVGLNDNGRRVLAYAQLRARHRGGDPRPASREIELHLTGNMERFIWGFDGKKFSDAEPIRLKLSERVRITLINDSMMNHPIHLHGLWSELENGQGEFRPYKHTINVKPGERLSYLVSADTPGRWAYHCHLLYHMETGMFREVIVA